MRLRFYINQSINNNNNNLTINMQLRFYSSADGNTTRQRAQRLPMQATRAHGVCSGKLEQLWP
jgi:hypothetical protein